MSEQEIENEIQEKGLNAPRLSPQDIDNEIVSEKYHRFENTTVTVCLLILKNGFTVVGESACVSMTNFNEELGKKIAKADARNKLWNLLGFLLKEDIFQGRITEPALAPEAGATATAPNEVK